MNFVFTKLRAWYPHGTLQARTSSFCMPLLLRRHGLAGSVGSVDY